jgi:uncharacterized protein YxjI
MSASSSVGATHYKMRQRLFAIGEDFDIENDRGERVFRIDGKVMRIRETFVLEDAHGREVLTIRSKLLALRDSMTISREGDTIATIRKAWLTPFRDKFTIDVKVGQDLVAQGDILDHEYEIRRGSELVAAVSKRWFSLTDTYGIEVSPGEDDALMLAIAVAIDEMVHDPDENPRPR